MRSPFALLPAGVALALGALPASADSLTPAQVLRVTFTVNNNFSPVAPDVMKLNFGTIQVLAPFTTRTAALYDGNTLLGTHDDSLFGNFVGPLNLDPTNAWATATSLWNFNNPAIVDFSTILDGSIQGRVDFSIATGEVDIPLDQVNLDFIRGTGPSSGTIVTPAPTLLSVQIVDPTGGGAVGTPFCFGDGSGSPCPCGNTGGAGEGCANSTGSGATLAASGSTGVGADDLVLDAAGLVPGQPALLFAGTNAIGGGTGALFGDGLRCAGQNIARLGVRVPNAQGEASWGPGLGAAGGWNAGETRYFQAWYRDPVNGPCGSSFNLSNGVQVDFTP